MNKRILIPVDFSENALNAIHYAQHLYKNVDCDFYLLNAFHVKGYSLDNMMMVPESGEPTYERAKNQSEKGLEKLVEQLKLHSDNTKHTYHTISVFNALIEAVKNTIDKNDIDVVIMGSKGKTGSKRVIYGTNTISVMEELKKCPVLMIPENVRFSRPKEIVFPTDYKIPFKRKELDYLIEIAEMHNCIIRVLYMDNGGIIDQKQQEDKVLLDTIFAHIAHSFHTLKDVKLQAGIKAFVESRECDMIVFINRKHHFLRKIVNKPLVKELGFYSNIPVLELNEPA